MRGGGGGGDCSCVEVGVPRCQPRCHCGKFHSPKNVVCENSRFHLSSYYFSML